MFIDPEDPREGNRRQIATRAAIERMLTENQRSKRSMSKFAGMGQIGRRPRSRRPFRGIGIRQFGGAGGVPERLGGFAQFLQNRGPGVPPGLRHVIDDGLMGGPHHAGPPTPLPLPPGPTAPAIPSLPGGGEGEQSGSFPSLPGSPSYVGGQLPPLGNAFGGLIPLGGGAWFDPATGQVHGPGGASPF